VGDDVGDAVRDEVPRPWEERPRSDWSDRWYRWRSDRRIGAALLACVAVAALAAWLRSGSSSSSAARLSPAPTSTPVATSPSAVSSTTTKSAAVIVVDVVGAVRRGGIVRLRTGARVVDAITAAGGAVADADLTRLNLAAVVGDGARVAVPRLGAPAPGIDPAAVVGSAPAEGDTIPGAAPSADAPVNLNTASAAQLDSLPGVGPATAAAIISDRAEHGPFRSVDDLGRVRGIGDAKLDQLRKLVTV
jgi:competence protein ComEA